MYKLCSPTAVVQRGEGQAGPQPAHLTLAKRGQGTRGEAEMPPRKGPAPAQAQPTGDKGMHRVGCDGQHGCWEVPKAPTTTALSPPHSVQPLPAPQHSHGPCLVRQ